MRRLQRGLSGINNNGSLGGNNLTRLTASHGGTERQANKSFEELKRLIHSKLVDKLDLSRVSDLAGDTLRREIRLVVERLCDTENPLLNPLHRHRPIAKLLHETSAFAPLRILL